MILVLDDDSAVRESLKFLLGIEGYDVVTYSSVDELLSDKAPPSFSGLIVDYHMPTMTGLDVIAKLRERRQPVPAILITGRADSMIREQALAAGVPVVDKPFRGTALLECIRTLIDGHPAT